MPEKRFAMVAVLFALSVAQLPVAARDGGCSELQGRTERSITTSPYATDSCAQDVRIFNSLRDGDFDFCRLKLGYVPGSADCLRVVTTTCTTVAFDGESFVPRALVDARSERIACPRGPVPPSCPSGIPEPLD